jgi:predicted unusual protein kinase regulating ubiquinone biosynthesis (AarF/ABC1/UbiB family)
MMDELTTDVRTGLVDLIFGVYENDTKDVCDAFEKIGLLRKGVDRLSVEKIIRFFLSEFSKGVSKDGKWANQLTKEEQRELTRQRRQQLGSDLFSVGSDVPFKFPPTFTFVFRAFTSLDGIGKGLDPKYDLTRLAQPFLKELIDLKDGSATLSLLKTWGKKLGWRPVDINDAITSPRKIAHLESILTRMEQGDLKVRVRVLESERAFQKIELIQNNMALGIAASGLLNAGLLLSRAGTAPYFAYISKAMLILAALVGLKIPIGLLQLKSLNKKFEGFN